MSSTRWILVVLGLAACGPTADPEVPFVCEPMDEGWDRESVLEPPDGGWARAVGITTHEGRTIVLASVGSSPVESRRVLRGFDRDGVLAWEHDGLDDEVGRALAGTPGGGAVLCDEWPVHREHRVTRFGPNGDVLWSTPGADGCGGIALTASGEVVVGGATEVSRFDADGQPLPAWPIEAPGTITDLAADGDAVAMLGYGSQVGFWISRLDERGRQQWLQEIGTEDAPAGASAVAVMDSGDIAIVGHVGRINGGSPGVPVTAGLWSVSASGDLLWDIAASYDPSGYAVLDDVVITPSGQLVATGQTGSSLVVAAFASDNGIPAWWDVRAGETTFHGEALAIDACGAAHVAGSLHPDAWVGRYTPPEPQ